MFNHMVVAQVEGNDPQITMHTDFHTARGEFIRAVQEDLDKYTQSVVLMEIRSDGSTKVVPGYDAYYEEGGRVGVNNAGAPFGAGGFASFRQDDENFEALISAHFA